MLHTNTLTKQLEFLESLDDEKYELLSLTPTKISLKFLETGKTEEHANIISTYLTTFINRVHKLPNCSVIVTN